MRARPKEHFRNDSISSKGVYRSPSIVNLGITKLKNLFKQNELDKRGSDYSVGIIVPSTKHGNQAISNKEFSKRVADTEKEFSGLFGGTTNLEQVGSYALENGKLVEEKGVAVVSNTDKKNFKKNRDEILDYARAKGKQWTQESIGVTVETPQHPAKSLHFIRTKD